MKTLLFFLLLAPVVTFGQYDFNTRYFKMDAESLTDLDDFDLSTLDFSKKLLVFSETKLSDYTRVTSQNYWQPVDMMTALEKKMPSTRQNVEIRYPQTKPKKDKPVTVSLQANGYNDTRNNFGVRNTVYKEMRSARYYSPLDAYRYRFY